MTPSARDAMVGVDSTPVYIFHPLVPYRMKMVLPRAKLILLLRDPTERCAVYVSWFPGSVTETGSSRAGKLRVPFRLGCCNVEPFGTQPVRSLHRGPVEAWRARPLACLDYLPSRTLLFYSQPCGCCEPFLDSSQQPRRMCSCSSGVPAF